MNRRRVAGRRGLPAFVLAAAWVGGGTGDAVGQPYSPPYPSPTPIPSATAAAPASPAVTYTPMVRPGSAPTPAPAASAPRPVPVAHPPPPVAPPPTPVSPPPAPAPVWPAPRAASPSPLAPTVAPAVPWPAPARAPWTAPPVSAWPAPALRTARGSEPPALAATARLGARPPGRRTWGLSLDVGLPDGLNAGLLVLPAPWMRLGAALGTNSASLEYRGSLAVVPLGWGPSFSLEAGHANMAPTNSVVRGFVGAPAWVSPYVQEFGYTYFNAHLGFDLVLGRVVLFFHGGYSYLMGTVRAPTPVVVDRTTNTTVTMAQDGQVAAGTLSAKLGLIVLLGGS